MIGFAHDGKLLYSQDSSAYCTPGEIRNQEYSMGIRNQEVDNIL